LVKMKKKRVVSKRKRKKAASLAISVILISAVIIFGTVYFVEKSVSNKEKYRISGIESYESGDYYEAINLLSASLDESQLFSEDMDLDTKLYLADSYMRTGNFTSANTVYRSLLATDQYKNDLTVQRYTRLTEALIDVSGGSYYDESIDIFEEELEEGNTMMYLYLGLCYQMTEDYEKMVAMYDKYADIYGMDSFMAYQISTYYMDDDKNDMALSYINEGLSCDDTEYRDRLLFNEIVIYEKAGDYSTALTKLETLCTEYPDVEEYEKEYTYLYTRLNPDTVPVHTESDAEESSEG